MKFLDWLIAYPLLKFRGINYLLSSRPKSTPFGLQTPAFNMNSMAERHRFTCFQTQPQYISMYAGIVKIREVFIAILSSTHFKFGETLVFLREATALH